MRLATVFNTMKSDKLFWFPFYLDEYLADTIGLRNAQHGAYLLSLLKYYKKRGALEDDELREICGQDYARISRFFIQCDGLWHHKRADIELAKSLEKMELNRIKLNQAKIARQKLGQIKS